MIEQTPLAPDIGDCPTFAVPHSNVSAYKVNFSQWNHNNSSLLVEGGVGTATGSPLQDLPLLPWLVLPQADGGQSRLHRSEARSTYVGPPRPSGVPQPGFRSSQQPLLQQLQKIPIDSFYRRTVPEDTHDCEADAAFNYDEVPSAFFEGCAAFLTQEVIGDFFECMNTTFGCIVPCYGGVYMPQNYSICTNASYFDHGIIGSCFENSTASLKTSCKITNINYGPLHVTSDQNTTR